MSKRALDEQMINTLHVRVTEMTVQIMRAKERVKFGFSRENIVDHFPKKKLMPIMNLKVPKVLPAKGKGK